MSQLQILRGVDEGKLYTFEEEVRIGTASPCEFLIEDRMAQGIELWIQKKQQQYFVSRNRSQVRVYLNGTPLQDTIEIQHSDVFQVGLTLIQMKTTKGLGEAEQRLKKQKFKNRYRVTRLFSQDLSGSYYQGFDEKMERAVLLHIVSEHLLNCFTDLKPKLLEWACLYASLTHSHLPLLLDFGEEFYLFFVYGFLGERLLSQELMSQKRFPMLHALALIKGLASALRFAQQHQLAHFNIHPKNIFMDPENRPILMGLGFDKILMESTLDPLTKAGWIGKFPYLAPEQLRKGDVTHLADLFSLGVLFFEMLTGHRPYTAEDPYQLLQQILKDPLPEMGIGETLPRLQKILEKLLAKDHNARYQNLRDLTNDLEVCSLIVTYRHQRSGSFWVRWGLRGFFLYGILPLVLIWVSIGLWYAYLQRILDP
jgi:serine/threonine protein kinase